MAGAIDVGAVWRTLDDRLGVGIAAQNLGMLDESEALPRNIRGGIAYHVQTPSSQAEAHRPKISSLSLPILMFP